MLYLDSIKPQFHILCEDESSTLDQKKSCLIKFAKQTILINTSKQVCHGCLDGIWLTLVSRGQNN